MTREEAVQLLFEYTKSDALRKHAFAVESCMIAYAEKFGEDVNEYSVTGILHDFDYEMYPNAPDHPLKGSEILRQKGVDEKIIKAILGHASYTNVERDTLLAKTLFECDELAGFITAVTYVRPNKTIDEVEVKSVTKKLKDKAFARNVSREDIYKGAEELGVPLEEHIAFCIEAMKKRKDLLGL
ncbi:MAG: HDIG domain-containing protein [Ignavibacteria bacterium]|jgi:putative nucleotidyltransferase with HDIG domain|nr:HDIG domain-containing protein [Ignavibacteria bacterium]MDH7527100.1 HDIG domain-containing protein [Ignavibacteria bacterium]